MQNSTTTVSTPNKSVLARLLATENISVEHRNVPTAAFDLKTRTLILPRWKDMSNALYDMLVGHEVSHALNTPQTGWRTDAERLAAKHGVSTEIAKQYLNITEDARIERLIKTKFPGLRADFFKGYGELHAQNFFQITGGTDMNTMCLGDRVNLHYKLGLHVGTAIAFTAEEQAIVDAVGAAATWADAADAADALLAWDAAQWQNTQNEPQTGEGENVDVESGGEGETSDESSESQRGEGESKTGTGNGSTGNESTPADGDAENGESASSSGNTPAKTSGSSKSKSGQPMPSPRTQSAMENAMKTLNEDSTRAYDVFRVQAVEPIASAIVPFTTVMRDVEGIMARSARGTVEPLRSPDIKSAASAMATAFDRRKAADTWRRTTVAKTGNIDTLRMNQYRWNEDIFRRTTRIAEGKNHGIVILLDWSGSMTDIMQATIGQLLILTDFCRTAGVPFEVFAFTDSVYVPLRDGNDQYSPEYFDDVAQASKTWEAFTKPGMCGTAAVSLVNFLSSRMTAGQYDRMRSWLWHGWDHICRDRRYRMGSTPTVAALHHVSDYVEQFMHTNRVQIAHTVVLTDGEATDAYYPASNTSGSYRSHNVMTDAKTGHSYDLQNHMYYENGDYSKPVQVVRGSVRWGKPQYNMSVSAAIHRLRARTGCRVHWIGLTDRVGTTVPSMSGFVADKRSNWSRDGYVRGSCDAFDTAVIASSARFNVDGKNAWMDKQLNNMEAKIESAKTARTLVTAVMNAQAMSNSMRSLSSLIGEYLAVA
jgi:hypothetical protein